MDGDIAPMTADSARLQKRVLLLGPTGVNKRDVFDRLVAERRDELKRANVSFPEPAYEDLEHLLYRRRGGAHLFLDDVAAAQDAEWERTWQKVFSTLNAHTDRDVFLSLHGVLVRPVYGTRSAVNLDMLRQFNPTDIFTLIDDVYAMWDRTEQRAGGRPWVGRPTLSALLDARRKETFFGDILARHLPPRANVLLAIRHPARVITRLIYGSPLKVYLSFPISAPRRAAAAGDQSLAEETTTFLERMAELEKRTVDLVFFSPLSIDELPCVALLDAEPESEVVTFEMARRWNLEPIFSSTRLLSGDPPSTIHLPRSQLADASGVIDEDVQFRDYRLVTQADRLVVYNPLKQKGNIARGVRNEIALALSRHLPIHVVQEPERGSIDSVKRLLMGDVGDVGQMGAALTDLTIMWHESVEDLEEALAERKERDAT